LIPYLVSQETRMTLLDPKSITTKMSSTGSEKKTSESMLRKYLDRIGIEAETADAMIGGRKPNESDLGLLLRAHLVSVPFENLSQHVHPPAEVEMGQGNTKTTQIEEIPIANLPTLDVQETLQKIVIDHRGGFCWEINTAFCWLLRELGYSVRLGSANVLTPDGPIPGHCCLYVDGLREDGVALHVDPGFGDAPRAPMPTIKNATAVVDPMIGDEHCFVPNNKSDERKIDFQQSARHLERFDTVLVRRRKTGGLSSSPMVDMLGTEETPPAPPEPVEEPMYLLNFDDDLEGDCEQFKQGLAFVLASNEKNMFSQKRFCVILREKGFDYVGSSYWKQVRNGSEVHRQKLLDEGAYRETLEKVAGIRLKA